MNAIMSKRGFFLKKRYLSSSGFVLLEALFCLLLVSFALWGFGFYLSLPKLPPNDQDLTFPHQVIEEKQTTLELSVLIFDVKYQKLQKEGEIYFSFEVLP